MKKKIVLCLGLSLLLVTLSGCNKIKEYLPWESSDDSSTTKATTEASDTTTETTPTVQSDTTVEDAPIEAGTEEQQALLSSLNGVDSIEGTLTMAIKLQIPMTAEEKERYESLGNDASYAFHNVNVGTELEYGSTTEISHYKGTLSKMGNAIVANPINIYTDEPNSIIYNLEYNEQTGSQVWTKNSESAKSLINILKNILGHTTNIVENNASTTRIIKGTINSTYVLEIPSFNYVDNEYFSLDKTVSGDLPIKIIIDTKTGYLSSIEVSLDDLMASDNVTNVSSEPLKIGIKHFNSTSVAIPEEAINTSGEEQNTIDSDISVYNKYFKAIYAPASDDANDEITMSIIHNVIGTQYDAMLMENGSATASLEKVENFLNFYSIDDLQEYMSYFKYCDEEEQACICIVAQLGIPGFDQNYLQETCIGNDTLDSIIRYYMIENDYMEMPSVTYEEEEE